MAHISINYPSNNDISQEQLLLKIKELERIVQKQKEELSKWPRAFWKSRAPESSTKGYKILQVEGKESAGWLDIEVEDADGEAFAAATDFGIYSSRESLERNIEIDNAEDS